MDLFYLLCVGRPKNSGADILYLFILPTIVTILLVYGIKNICENSGKKDIDSMKKFNRGLISFISFLVLSVLLALILSVNANTVKDACDNYSPLFSVTRAIMNIVRILIVPAIFFVKTISLIVKWLSTPKEKRNPKKEIIGNIVRYIIIVVLVFIIITIYSAVLGLVTNTETSIEGNKSVSWSQCWCSD